MKKGLSEKELSLISKLELEEKYFFTRKDVLDNFKNTNEMNVYIHRLKNKGRIIKINKTKYFLIPIKAVNNKWSEHPFIIIDEIMNGKDYCIVGKAAAYYWKFIDQIPFEFEVYNTRKQKFMMIFKARLNFIRRRKNNMPKSTIKKVHNHNFIIATKEECKKWK